MNNQQSSLTAPTIPVAQVDGLIKTSDLASDILIFFPFWPGAAAGDTKQLLINNKPVGEATLIPDPDPGSGSELELSIPVATELREDGFYSIGYRATNTINGVAEDSLPTVVRIDRTEPGAAMLASIFFPAITLGDWLKGRVPGYSGMEAGDMIQTVCNGTHGPAYRIHPENLTTLPIEITFTREFLEGLFSDKVNITYHVTDRAGNRSILAQSVELTLQR
jgi:hypothetical protein